MSALPTSSGIYVITCKANGKIYIGGALNIRRRSYRHWYDLREGCHKNPLLQAAWNEHDESDFKCEVLELCKPDDVKAREQHYLDTMKPFDDKGFNIARDSMRPNVGRTWTVDTSVKIRAGGSKTYIVTSPDGTQTRITNLRQFCRENGLNHSNMSAVANGKNAQHKGWRCAHVDHD